MEHVFQDVRIAVGPERLGRSRCKTFLDCHVLMSHALSKGQRMPSGGGISETSSPGGFFLDQLEDGHRESKH